MTATWIDAEDDALPIRVVVSKIGLDGHDRGAKVIARGLRDAGMEVIYTGLRRRPEELAEIVLQEDAQVLGLSILSGAVVPLSSAVLEAMRTRGMEDVLVLVGGIVSDPVRQQLRELGIDGAFGPGTSIEEIVRFTHERLRAQSHQAL
jgi:methylmalonyl-CoA mutase C-terminal domain/subunit